MFVWFHDFVPNISVLVVAVVAPYFGISYLMIVDDYERVQNTQRRGQRQIETRDATKKISYRVLPLFLLVFPFAFAGVCLCVCRCLPVFFVGAFLFFSGVCLCVCLCLPSCLLVLAFV